MKINAKDIFHTYNAGKDDLLVISGINLNVPDKQFVAIIGPSGCGKTTILKIIGGFLEPSRGHVIINANSPQSLLSGNKIGFVFQNPTLLKWKTARENVLLPVEVMQENNGGPMATDLSANILDAVGLKGFYDSYPRELSQGMQQRVSLARALIFDPELLLMDEPFGALDGLTRQKMQTLLLRIWEEKKKTILFVTHDITEAIFLADRVIVLSKRPAQIVADIPITLERHRERHIRSTKEFIAYEEQLWSYLGE